MALSKFFKSYNSRRQIDETELETIAFEEVVQTVEVPKKEKKLTVEQKRGLFKIINDCKELLSEEFYTEQFFCEECLKGSGVDFVLKKDEFLEKIVETAKMSDCKLPEITEIMVFQSDLIKDKFEEIKVEVEEFQKNEKILTDEIVKFTNAVKEAKAKYKLSPDWNGKKPALMAYSEKLKSQKEVYGKKEENLVKYFKKMYLFQKEFEVLFKDYCGKCLIVFENCFNEQLK